MEEALFSRRVCYYKLTNPLYFPQQASCRPNNPHIAEPTNYIERVMFFDSSSDDNFLLCEPAIYTDGPKAVKRSQCLLSRNNRNKTDIS